MQLYIIKNRFLFLLFTIRDRNYGTIQEGASSCFVIFAHFSEIIFSCRTFSRFVLHFFHVAYCPICPLLFYLFVLYRFLPYPLYFSPGISRLYRLGVSQAQKPKVSGDKRPRLRAT